MFTLRDSVVVFAFVLFLSACGGGQQSTGTGEETTSSSSTETTTTTQTSDEPTVLEGRAVKGLVLNAQLDAYILENDSRRHVGSTQTDDQGHYSLELSDSSGPVVIEMTPAGDGSSTMVCDAVDGCGSAGFGQEFPLPTDFFISSLIIPSDSTSGGSITPLTHIAAEWAQAMPGAVTDQHVKLARARVAGVFQIDSGFTFHDEPDLTDPQSLDGADEASARHSLISAAFLERAADTEDTLQDVIDGYTQSLTNHAGQVENQGTYSLYNLFDAAYEIADTQDILPDIRSSLDLQIAGLGEGVSSTTTSTSYNQQNYDDALVALDDLNYYLNETGIDASASFFSDQFQQVEWLQTENNFALFPRSPQGGALLSFWTSLVAGAYEDIPDSEKPSQLDWHSNTDNFSSVYNFEENELTVTGTENGQYVDLTVQIPSVTGDKKVFEYDVQGSVENPEGMLDLDGTMTLDFQDTDLAPFLSKLHDMIHSGTSSQEDLKAEFKNFAPNVSLKASFNGDSKLAKPDDPDFGFDLNQVSGWMEWNTSYVNEGGTLVAKKISTGELVTPEGDRISDNADTSDPALAVQIGDNSSMQADFVTEAFGLPRMEFQIQGDVANTGSLLDAYSDKLDKFLNSDFNMYELVDMTKVIDMLPDIDYSFLDINGSANLTIEDMDRGEKVYEFTLDGNSVHASLPNSTDRAFSFHFNGRTGGYVTADGTMVATVTFDSEDLGASIYFVDGTERSYYLGPLNDFILPEIMDKLEKGFQ